MFVPGGLRSVLAGAVLVSLGQGARAGYTDVINNPNEPSHLSIVDHLYGGSFSGSPQNGFTGGGASGAVVLTRIADFGLAQPLDLAGTNLGSATDELWADGIVDVSARARFSDSAKSFGFLRGEGRSVGFTKMFDITSDGFAVQGDLMNFDIGAVSHTWRWAREQNFSLFSSRDDDNDDLRDHMVTYFVEGLDNGYDATWLLFFEDLDSSNSDSFSKSSDSDRDFNDLVIEVNANIMKPIPLPNPALLGAAGLGVVIGLRRRR